MRELPFDLRFEPVGDAGCTSSTARRARSTSTCSRTSRPSLFERIAAARLRRAGLRPHPQAVDSRVRRRAVRQLRLGRQAQGRRPARRLRRARGQRRAASRRRIERVRLRRRARRRRGRRRRGCPASTPRSCWSPHDATDDPPLAAPPARRVPRLGLPRRAGDRLGDRRPDSSRPTTSASQLLENAAATAAGLFAIILMFGPVSGGHFNPVVSLVDAALRRPALARRARLHPGPDRRLHRRRDRRQRDVRAAGDQHLHPPPRLAPRTCSPRSSRRSGSCW